MLIIFVFFIRILLFSMLEIFVTEKNYAIKIYKKDFNL